MKITPAFLRRTATNLFHALLVWMSSDSGNVAPGFQMDEEQHIIGHKSTPSENFHGKEIAASENIHVSREKVLPRRDLASLGSRGNTVTPEDILRGLIRHPATKVGQGTDDAVISPARVLSRHADSQGFDF